MSDPKLTQITLKNNFRSKVEAILQSLVDHGEDPKIAEALRTLEQQKEKVAKGYSKTLKSYHLGGSDGLARAADIVDRKKGWNANARFWLLLAANCEARQISWGGLFGLTSSQKQAVVRAIKELRDSKWPDDHPAYQVRRGWDPAHVEASTSNWPLAN